MPAATGEPNPILLFFLLFALILGVIGLMAFISRAKAWLRGEPFFPYDRLMSRPLPTPPVQAGTPHTEPVNARSVLPDATFSERSGTNVQIQPDDFQPPNVAELRQLGEAIRHKVNGATKQQAVEVAFGVKKGGSEAWKRASRLFDLATAPPPDPHPHLTAQRQQQRWEPTESAAEKS